MKVLAINGSARADGNTAILLRHVLGEIEKEGIACEMFQLSGRTIRGCTACFKCLATKDKTCAVVDDANELIAKMFEALLVAERQHERRYLGLAKNVEAGTVFKKNQEVTWRCRNCGYLHKGKEAPSTCPACAHPQAYFELLGENW